MFYMMQLDNVSPLDGTSWMLVSLDGQPPLPGTEIRLGFSDKGFSGNSGCNYYAGSYTNDNGNLLFLEYQRRRQFVITPISFAYKPM
jgi:heat shock protein HslJ